MPMLQVTSLFVLSCVSHYTIHTNEYAMIHGKLSLMLFGTVYFTHILEGYFTGTALMSMKQPQRK